MDDISGFDKDQLAEYAKSNYGIELDMRKNLANLMIDVIALQKKPKVEKIVKPENPKATHIKNTETGFVFPWTSQLQVYLKDRFVLCDESGNTIS
jgi:hypothetical protein